MSDRVRPCQKMLGFAQTDSLEYTTHMEEQKKECLFCKIVARQVPAEIEYEDEDILVFADIHPKAPVHLLIVPKRHIEQFADLVDGDWPLWIKMSKTAQEFIEDLNLRKVGYRLVVNGAGAALIQHLHLHLLGDVEHTRDI